ncbi:hypothetical protein H6G63_27675 [Leptolyngbya sp. FACHB-402]|nr:hypothetical protein [Leptolyngbya sp. FACHB-161]MBD2377951.1 hypothetical protein [Leptolyngbya sp. FACHB-238]MBD2401419.1 hypothetical protein [Leptolyngbya sp. FACHB-239]MBD2407970.1 hypothetical protein [Leptolyngbya sp. FACHB-402]
MTKEKLLFEPWIGSQYGSDSLFGISILVVGESNYTDNQDRELPHNTFTHRLIEDAIDGCQKHRFFKYIRRTFMDDVSPKAFWHSVAYQEYIQDWLPCPGVSPDEEMWQKAKPLFQDVVNELKPQCILFVSKGVYDRASKNFSDATSLTICDDVALRIYKPSHPTVQIHQSLASWIYHPSSRRGGFRRPRPVVKALVEAAGGRLSKT